VLNWGIGPILWLQGFSPLLDLPFKLVTFLGNKEFLILFFPLLYWCVDRRVGMQVAILFLISAYLNDVAKMVAAQPRPFQYDTRVKAIVHTGGGGLPSGHTQGAVVVWGYLAYCTRRPWMWALAVGMMVLIPLSRLYLGVHFPTDLLGGYALGGMILWVYIRVGPKATSWLHKKRSRQYAVAVMGPALMLVFAPSVGNGVVSAATLMGMGVGVVLERETVHFECNGRWWMRITRYILGVCVLLGFVKLGASLFSEVLPHTACLFLTYGIVGFWVAFGAPWLFVKLRLTDQGPGRAQENA